MKLFKSIVITFAMMVSVSSYAQFTTGGVNSGSIDTESTLNKGYKGFVDLGYGIGVGDYDEGRIEFSTTHGYQFSPYFFAGIGVGVNYFHEGDAVNIPIFADFRGTLPIQNTKVTPFLDMRLGYSVNDVEGFYFTPSVGVRLAVSKKCGLNIGLGYELQKAKVEYYSYYYDFEDTVTAGAITFKLGIDF